MEYNSQRDKRWANEKLGNGSTTIGGYGCYITSLSNLSKEYNPSQVNTILRKGGCFNGDLLINPERIAKLLNLEYHGRNNMVIRNPEYRTIAEVDMSPAVGKQQHFVVIKEDGSIIDPWNGTIRPKGTYPLVSYRLFKRLPDTPLTPITPEPIKPSTGDTITPETTTASYTAEPILPEEYKTVPLWQRLINLILKLWNK